MSRRDPSTWVLPDLDDGPLVAEFASVDRTRWAAKVDAARPGTLAGLERTTEDGIAIAPLYTAEAASAEAVPVGNGTTLVGRLHEDGDAEGLAETVATESTAGVDCAWIRLDAAQRAGCRVAGGRGLSIAPTRIGALANAGTMIVDAGRAAGACLRQLPDAHQVEGILCDPFATLGETGGYGVPLPEAVAEVAANGAWAANHRPGIAVALADGATVHDAGATEALEVGVAIASGLTLVEALIAAGVEPDRAAAQTMVLLAVDHAPQAAIAKLRATRLLWMHALSHVGARGAAPRLWVRSSMRARTRDDAANNLLRATLESFSAMAGGADGALILPGPNADLQTSRLARQTMVVLRDESHLLRVVDPGAGSWAVEARTAALAEAAWAVVQQIGTQGGVGAALREGWVHARIEAAAQQRRARVASQRMPLTGVTIYPAPDATGASEAPVASAPPGVIDDARGEPAVRVKPLSPRRLSAPFEALADRARRHPPERKAVLVPLGGAAKARPQLEFAGDLLSTGGVSATRVVAADDAWAEAAVAVLCGGPEAIAEHGATAATAAKAGGVAWVVVAGRPSSEAMAALTAAGVDEVVHRGRDLFAALSRIHTALEIGGAS